MQILVKIALSVGIILFFLVAILCLGKGLPLAAVLTASFSAWLAALKRIRLKRKVFEMQKSNNEDFLNLCGWNTIRRQITDHHF